MSSFQVAVASLAVLPMLALLVLGVDWLRLNKTHQAVMTQQIEIAQAEAWDQFSRAYLRPSGYTARVDEREVPVYFAVAPMAILRTMSFDSVELVKDGVGCKVPLSHPIAALSGDTVMLSFPPSRREADYTLKV